MARVRERVGRVGRGEREEEREEDSDEKTSQPAGVVISL